MNDKIEPCPFCGGKAGRVIDHRKDINMIRCLGNNNCFQNVAFYPSMKEAIAAWNKRTPDARLEAERAVIEAAKEAGEALARYREQRKYRKIHLRQVFAAVDALAALARTEKKP